MRTPDHQRDAVYNGMPAHELREALAATRARALNAIERRSTRTHGERQRDGSQWIGDACTQRDSNALRFVGFADELAPRSVKHCGWFIDSVDQCDVLRGAVFRLTRKRGLVAGYVERSGERAWGTLNCGAVVHVAQRFDCDDAIGAACFADDMARHAAEREREWRDAESESMEACECIAEARAEHSALASMDMARHNPRAVVSIRRRLRQLRATVAACAERIRSARATLARHARGQS